MQAIGVLRELKHVRTVLTQGGTSPMLQNVKELKEIIEHKGDLNILLGGGLKLENFNEVQSHFKNC